jgi:ABC-type Fe3+/spermidine/putrescine transport system ATPase subunit
MVNPPEGSGAVAVRPENITFASPAVSSGQNEVKGVVRFITFKGSEAEYRVELTEGQVLRVRHPTATGLPSYKVGTEVRLKWSPAHTTVLDN